MKHKPISCSIREYLEAFKGLSLYKEPSPLPGAFYVSYEEYTRVSAKEQINPATNNEA